LAMMFVGCIDPVAEDTGGVVTEVFNLQTIIATAPVGVIADDAAFSVIFGTSGFVKCGNPPLSIIDDGGVKKLKIGKAMANGWGEGVDLTFAKIGFKAGDEITLKGTAETGKNGVMLNGKGGAYYRIGEWNSNDDNGVFNKTFVLTSEDITAIKTGSPQVIRIHYGPSDGDARKGDIIIEQITVKGIRGAGPSCDCEAGCGECGMDGCGPQCSANAPEKFDDKGTTHGSDYKIPADSVNLPDNEFYLPLGYFNSDTIVGGVPDATAGIPTASFSKDSVKLYFDRTDQRVNFLLDPNGTIIPAADVLTAAQKTALKTAITSGEPFKVLINGKSSPDAPVRYGFIDWTTGSNYNATGMPQGKFSANLNGTLTKARDANDDNTRAFTIQLREGPWSGVIIEIKSIKVILPVVQIVNITDLAIAAPVPGEPLQRSLSTDQFNGSIAWSNGDVNAAPNKSYTATVTLTAKNQFWTFDGLKDAFTVGSIKQSGQLTSAANSVTVQFYFYSDNTQAFPDGTQNSGNGNPTAAVIKPQKPATTPITGLVNLEDTVKNIAGDTYAATDVKDGIVDTEIGKDVLTATYIRATHETYSTNQGVTTTTLVPDGPLEGSLTIRWQYLNGSVWETKGTGKTFTPGELGSWRILISAPSWTPKASDIFMVYGVNKAIPVKVPGVNKGTATEPKDQTVLPVAVNGSVISTADEKGYILLKTQGWAWAYAYIRIELPTGKKMSDYKTLKCTVVGSGGDPNYKNAGIIVSDSVFTSGTSIITGAEESKLSNGTAPGSNWGVDRYSNGTNNLTFTLANTTGGIILPGGTASTSNNPYVCIYIHSPQSAVYAITNIELTE